jgi:hypothetical protein
MSDQAIWKTLHLLRLYARDLGPGGRGLSEVELDAAGIDSFPDTIWPLVDSGAVERLPTGHLTLGRAARFVLDHCIVGNKRWVAAGELRVDYPSAFVIMPFSESWSDDVWNQLIAPAVAQAGLACVRGDVPLRVADLTNTVWNAIASAGLVIADLSAPNVNVYYRLGLAHALGRDTFILKQRGVQLAADFGGTHYYEYDRGQPGAARQLLTNALGQWAADHRTAGVYALSR